MRRRIVIPAAALVMAACSDVPMAPDAANVPAMVGATLSLSAGSENAALDFTVDLELITTRVVPNFTDREAAEQLQLHITELTTALNAGDKAEAARILDLARASVTTRDAAWGDVGYIELVFNNIAQALQ